MGRDARYESRFPRHDPFEAPAAVPVRGGRPISRRGFVGLTAAAALSLAARNAGWAVTTGARADLHVLVLGSIQDGGLPQAGCYTPRCDRGREEPRYVASLALIESDTGRAWLVDASPDLIRQMDLIPGEAFRSRAGERRPFEGILLTHAHIGHYLGLALLGREGLAIRPTACYCTARMAGFLSSNGPWNLMVDEGRLDLRTLEAERPVRLRDDLEVTALPVPHRDEFSDTVGLVFRGPRRSLLYLPDIDRWDRWDRAIEDVVAGVDVALVDGTFYAATEVPGRSQQEIPHPLIPDTMKRLQSLAARGGKEIVFTHLNNTNPVVDSTSQAYGEVRRRGFSVARAGQRYAL